MTPGLAGFIASGHDERAWDESLAGVLEALGSAFGVVPDGSGKPAAGRRTWLDTFDWRLHRAGLTLEYAGRPRGGELLLSGNAANSASPPVTASPPSTASTASTASTRPAQPPQPTPPSASRSSAGRQPART